MPAQSEKVTFIDGPVSSSKTLVYSSINWPQSSARMYNSEIKVGPLSYEVIS